MTWALLGLGTALAAQTARVPRRRAAGVAASRRAAQEIGDGSAGGSLRSSDGSLPAT